jgi:hypothetical protein
MIITILIHFCDSRRIAFIEGYPLIVSMLTMGANADNGILFYWLVQQYFHADFSTKMFAPLFQEMVTNYQLHVNDKIRLIRTEHWMFAVLDDCISRIQIGDSWLLWFGHFRCVLDSFIQAGGNDNCLCGPETMLVRLAQSTKYLYYDTMEAIFDFVNQSVKLLLDHGANMEWGKAPRTDKYNWTFFKVIHIACGSGNVPLLRLLLDNNKQSKKEITATRMSLNKYVKMKDRTTVFHALGFLNPYFTEMVEMLV